MLQIMNQTVHAVHALQLVVDQNYTVADAASAMDVGLSTMTRWGETIT